MDFAVLPPEINSARMYAGPGSGPMRAAAAAWGALATDLNSAATSYESVVSELTGGSWLGQSSASMAAATAPYVVWMSTTAELAEQVATQATAAAAAYEAAFAATVPPPVIAANRAQLMELLATNLLGQNTAAIAATEAHYSEMWAQDSAAMYGYAGSSATAAQLTPFAPPPQTTNAAGLAAQTAAHVTGTSVGTGTQQALSQLTSAMPNALQGLAAPTQALPAAAVSAQVTPPLGLANFLDLLGLDALAATAIPLAAGLTGGAWAAASQSGDQIVRLEDEALRRLDHLHQEHHEMLAILGHPRPDWVRPGDWPSTSADVGRAVSVGGLSAPPSWAVAAPEIRTVGNGLPATSVGAAPAASVGSAGTAFSEMALAGMGGSALAGVVSGGRRERVGATTGERVKSPQRLPGGPVTAIAPELRELAALHDEGILTDEEFKDQKLRLLSR